MYIEQPDQNNIKIIIGVEELAVRDISIPDLVKNKVNGEEFFRELLTEAQAADHFFDGSVVSFKMTPLPDELEIEFEKTDIDPLDLRKHQMMGGDGPMPEALAKHFMKDDEAEEIFRGQVPPELTDKFHDLMGQAPENFEGILNGELIPDLMDMLADLGIEAGIEAVPQIAGFFIGDKRKAGRKKAVPNIKIPGAGKSNAPEPSPVLYFGDIEDLIFVAKNKIVRRFEGVTDTALYNLSDGYYLTLDFNEEASEDVRFQIGAILHEFGHMVDLKPELLPEYGTLIFESDVFENLRKNFK
ncbi:MAG: adaptor protein MecA [Lactobacillales bacterium]|nr:adaptor protein MecA [Lactobacillales bacterium]